MNVCPLCGNKLKNGYCPECGGNITNVCDADEPLEVHESHASVMPRYSSPEEKSSFSKEMNQKAFLDAKEAYNASRDEMKALLEEKMMSGGAGADNNGEAQKKATIIIKVVLILCVLLIPTFGWFVGIVLAVNSKKSKEWRKFGIILLIVAIISFFTYLLMF